MAATIVSLATRSIVTFGWQKNLPVDCRKFLARFGALLKEVFRKEASCDAPHPLWITLRGDLAQSSLITTGCPFTSDMESWAKDSKAFIWRCAACPGLSTLAATC